MSDQRSSVPPGRDPRGSRQPGGEASGEPRREPRDEARGAPRIRDLRELARDVPPPRDLWPAIRAQIDPTATGGATGGAAGSATRGPADSAGATGGGALGGPAARRMALGLAAAIALVAVGVWAGRSSLPGAGTDAAGLPGGGATPAARRIAAPDTTVQPVAYVADPRYREQRARLLADVEARIAELPPGSQAKVRESLATIQKAVADLEAELGREPSSALLQELLVNARQDEMRLLTTITEAGAAGRET
jgi:hypothetical protein